MATFFIGFFTVVLVLTSLFMVFVVLLQRGSQNGAGAAFGGGAAESAFGGETTNVLTRATVITAIVFFVVGLGLYLGNIASHKQPKGSSIKLESIVAGAEAKNKPATPAEPATPVLGETTAKAMEVLAAETKSGQTAEVVKSALESAKQETDSHTVAPGTTK